MKTTSIANQSARAGVAKVMRRSTNLAILVVAIILGALAAFLARSWLKSHSENADAEQTASIVVAKGTLAFGAPIAADDVREIAWPAKSRPEGAYANFAELVKDGRRIVLSPFVRDEPIIASKVSAPNQRASLSAVIEKGKRAVTVAVDDVRGVAGFIFPGDFVDVVVTRTNSSDGPQNFSEVILQHVKVLAIDQMAGERQEHPTVAKAVTVEVSPEQALRILLATNVGKLSLILRQPAEVAIGPDAKITDRDLFGSDAAQASAAAENPRPPPTLAQVAFLQPQPAPVVRPPPPSPTEPATRKITVVRSVKSEQYDVPRESR
jgi:pilus assembly protein CpaB